MHSCMPWLNSISRKDETPQLSLGSGGATVCFQQELVSCQRNAQEKPGTTLQKLLLELSQVAGNLKL